MNLAIHNHGTWIRVLLLASLVCAFALQARQINVGSANPSALPDSLAKAAEGDVLNLTDAGPYQIVSTLTNSAAVTIQGDPGLPAKALIKGIGGGIPLFTTAANLILRNLELDCLVSAGRAVKLTGTKPNLRIEGCIIHDTADDLLRTDTGCGVVVLDDVFAYNIGDSPLDIRGGTGDTLKVLNSTFFKAKTKSRIDVVISYVLFDAVTILNTRDSALNFRQDAPQFFLKNTLIVNSTSRPLSMQKGLAGAIDYCNFFQDPVLVASGSIDSTFSSSEPKTKELFKLGSGNIEENPQFSDTTRSDLRVSMATQTAFGSEWLGPIGDPRWGSYDPTGVESQIEKTIAERHALLPNYPNPFNASTVISFELAHHETVTIDIFNLRGAKVRSLVNGIYPAGLQRAFWNGQDDSGLWVSAGVYIVQLRAGQVQQTRKVTILK
jgi:hypothetical protein